MTSKMHNSTSEINEYAELTEWKEENLYKVGELTKIKNKEYTVLKVSQGSESGFAGITLYDEVKKKAYIVPKGSVPLENVSDLNAWSNDWLHTNLNGFGTDNISDQMKESIDFANDSLTAIKNFEAGKGYDTKEIVATAHSLAGGEVQLWGMMENFSDSKIKLYTFNAAPAGNLYDDLLKYANEKNFNMRKDKNFNNMFNFSVKGDPVSDKLEKAAWLKHAGKIFELDTSLGDKHAIQNFTSPFTYSDFKYSADTIGDNIKESIQNLMDLVKQTFSPLTLDLNGDGVQTIGKENNIYFDLDASGFAEKTGWISADDGFLVYDRNENGIIDNGTELFGDYTPGNTSGGGFEALAQFDSNADGVISAVDQNFDKLQIWRDYNVDGISEINELHSLDTFEIVSINLNYEADNTQDEYGNIFAQRGTYDKSDYTTGAIIDVRFTVETAYSRPTEILEVPENIANLPEVMGFGNVHSLHQAMVRDTSDELKTLVEQFVAETNKETRHDLVSQIIFRWTNGQDLDPYSRDDGWFDTRKLNALEQFMGQKFQNQNNYVGPGAVTFLEPAFQKLHRFVYSQLMSQSHLKNLYSLIEVEFNTETNEITYDNTALIAELQNQIAQDEQAGKDLLGEFASSIHGLNIANSIGYQEIYDAFSQDYKDILDSAAILSSGVVEVSNGQVGDYNENIVGDENDNLINGYGGNDLIYGEQGNDLLNGGDGNDAIEGDSGLYTESGSDILEGGKGNDYLDGGIGNDIYKFNLGDGQDVINDTASYTGNDRFRYIENIDVIQFGSGIAKEDIEVAVEGTSLKDGSLFIKIKGTDDQIKILSQFDYDYSAGGYPFRIERLEFSNGDVITHDKIFNYLPPIDGTNGDDNLRGRFLAEQINGFEGNDTLYGYTGNDTIAGAEGNDLLKGGQDSDTYIFNLGDGYDTIWDSFYENSESGYYDGGTADTIRFGEGIILDNIAFASNKDDDLYIYFKDSQGNLTSDRLVIQNQLKSTQKIEYFEFSNGDTLSSQEIYDKLAIGSNNDDTINGTFAHDTIYGDSGNDIINGNNGNDDLWADDGDDTLIGGEGDDTMRGRHGNDTYIYNMEEGNDIINDSYPSIDNSSTADILKFGEGITVDNIVFSRDESELYQDKINNLIIRFKDENNELTDDSIKIWNYYFQNSNGDGGEIESFEFADGSILTPIAIASRLDAVGSSSDDTINLTTGKYIYAFEGNDNITANSLDNYINAGAGNDTVDGGAGNDTYIFNLGDGKDLIIDDNGYDTIKFGEGIAVDNIAFASNNEDDLYIYFKDVEGNLTDDRIIIQNQLTATPGIEVLEFSNGDTLSNQDVYDKLPLGSSNDDTITGTFAHDTIYGESGNDLINGSSGNDDIWGDNGGDTVTGSIDNGDDTIIGGKGNDTMRGRHGNDTYIYNQGDGNDYINDPYSGSDNTGSADVLQFGEGITVDNILFAPDKINLHYSKINNLIIRFKDENNDLTDGSINIWNYYFQNSNGKVGEIETFRFDDGSTLTPVDIENRLDALGSSSNDNISLTTGKYMYAFAGNDSLTANTLDNYINAGSGNDTIYGGNGNDTIDGKEGNDDLWGDSGDDTLIGGEGDDTMHGRHGNDTYIYNMEEGNDIINDSYPSIDNSSTADILKFGEGITVDNIIFASDEINLYNNQINNLLIRFKDENNDLTDDSIKITNYYFQNSNGDGGEIENFEFVGGNTLTSADIASRLDSLGSSSDDIINLTTGKNIYAFAGDDNITANALDNYINSGTGNDTINGGAGNDTYIFNLGDNKDVIIDSNGYDNLKFGENINLDDLQITTDEADLIITIKNTTDKITIQGWYDNNNNKIEQIQLIDGTILDQAQIEELVQDFVLIPGTSSNDNLEGTDVDNMYTALQGNDTITDLAGNDLYLYSLGDGEDIISDLSGNDTIELGEGIIKDDMTIIQSVSDLAISFNSQDKITIKDWLVSDSNKIENIVFTDNTNISAQELMDKITIINGTTSDDSLTGNSNNNKIYGLDGDDILYGSTTQDSFYGGFGDDTYIINDYDDFISENTNAGIDKVETNLSYTLDTNFENITLTGSSNINGTGNNLSNLLIGNDGDNTLYGGLGKDTLTGGLGNDTYVFNITDGKDVINDLASNDSISLGEGITEEDLTIIKEASDLIISVNTNDQITIKDWFVDDLNKIENILFADESLLTAQEVEDKATIIKGTNVNDTIYGGSANNNIQSYEGNDEIYGEAGDDTIDGGIGADTMKGSIGNDTYYVDNTSDKITENADEGIDTVNSYIDHTLSSNTENLVMQSGAIKGYGNTLNNTIHGNSENNILGGSSYEKKYIDGDDTIFANDGDDKIYPRSGNDYIEGGLGNDKYIFDDQAGFNTVVESGGTEDIIYLRTDIDKDKVGFFKQNNNLIIGFNDNNSEFGQITVKDHFASTDNRVEKVNDSTATDSGLDINSDEILDIVTKIEQFAFDNDLVINSIDDVLDNYTVMDFINSTWDSGVGELPALNKIEGSSNSETLTGTTTSIDAIYGYSGNDTITGASFANRYNDGYDSIYAGDGDDKIYSRSGNDYIEGGLGNDKYIFDDQAGFNTVVESGGTEDIIYLRTDIDKENVGFLRKNNNLIIGFNDNNGEFGQVTVKDHFASADNEVEKIKDNTATNIIADLNKDEISNIVTQIDQFAIENDLVINSVADVLGNSTIMAFISDAWVNGVGKLVQIKTINIIEGDSSNNTIEGTTSHLDQIYAYSGNDTITGAPFEKRYDDAEDTIYAGDGDDKIYPRTGNDYIEGGLGNDKYYFDDKSGLDMIVESGGTEDIVYLRTDIDKDKVGFFKQENDLIVGFNDNNGEFGQVAIKDHFANIGNQVEVFSDITATNFIADLNKDEVLNIVTQIEQFAIENTLDINNVNDVLSSPTIMAFINSAWTNGVGELATVNLIEGSSDSETITGSAGVDAIYAYSNNDSIDAGTGNDYINGGTGADTMTGGNGSDKYIVDNINDIVSESNTDGYDTVISSVDFTLLDNIEKLEITGEAISAIGNDLNNYIAGNSKDNTIQGSKGNDSIVGSLGSDTYTFNLDDGEDTLIESSDPEAEDIISFESTVLKDKIAIFQDSSNNLIIDYGNTSGEDQITIVDQDANASTYEIEKIKHINAAGTDSYLDSTQIGQIVESINSYASSHSLSLDSVNDVKDNQELMNIIVATW